MNTIHQKVETLENPSNQKYKLKINYVLNEQTAPLPLFGGIFSTFGVEKETGIKYYNYMENQKYKEDLKKAKVNNNNDNIQNNPSIPIYNSDKDIFLKKILLNKIK